MGRKQPTYITGYNPFTNLLSTMDIPVWFTWNLRLLGTPILSVGQVRSANDPPGLATSLTASSSPKELQDSCMSRFLEKERFCIFF